MSQKSLAHDSARGHVTGESVFLDDRPLQRNELHVGLVVSPVAHGYLRAIDTSAALQTEGVAGIFTAADLHHNLWGTIIQDQPLLADHELSYVGEPIAVIAATSRSSLQQARRLIKLEIETLPAILTIDQARQQESFIAVERTILQGDPDTALASAPHQLSGVFESKGQDHFYLESHISIVYPLENGQLEVHASSQHPTEVQHLVAEALGLNQSQVTCIVKRMGGGFGGKESQAATFSVYAALVAHKLRRPARLALTKDEDMVITGKRHPFKNWYTVGFDAEGRIQALDVRLFADGGAYADLSTSILERAMLHSDNAYYLPHARIVGRICRTHHTPHTAFRGFGGPQGVAMIENVLEEIAQYLHMDALNVRRINLYRDHCNLTPYGQVVENNTLPRLFEQIVEMSDYDNRRKDVTAFNASSRTHLRGLALTAVKFGISFTTRFLNQGNALVNVHRDGTVQVSTGATEMGQGVNTKILQVVAEALGIPPEQVVVLPTATDKNHNTSPTAASSGSDINCAAALLACEQIRQRMAACLLRHWEQPVRDALTEIKLSGDEPVEQIEFSQGFLSHRDQPEQRMSFAEAVNLTYLNRISLSGYGHYKTPIPGYDRDRGKGHPFLYFTNGMAVSEVLIDRLTGEHKVLSSEILIDLGRPINEGIDKGQVTGAFVQGMGWVTGENLIYSETGHLLSHSPTTYKIPNIQDTPRHFKVEFLENFEPTNVRGSKAVGEPPLLLGFSVWAAIKNALSYVGPVSGLQLPASHEEILLHVSRQPALSGRV
jgi:xanthine dehydrogenase large subunit